jgi:RNA polymerase sigma-70 factor (sigma-E family)
VGQTGDFEDFCRAEYDRVARTAYWLSGDRQEATDLTQEAFARAFQRWKKLRLLDRPDAWVQRVVVNLALSHLRRRRFLPRLVSSLPERAKFDPEPPDPQLRRALLSLTDSQRVVIVLRYYLDRSIEEVARGLGKRPGTIRALTSQGLARLRQVLASEQLEVTHEARR